MSKRLILSLISLGLISFLSVLIETSLNVTFEYLTKTYEIDIKTASLLTSMFLLALTLIMPTSSFLLQRFNTKKLFIFTNFLFLLSLLVCASFNNFYILVLARFLQGIAAGIALPLMFNIVIIKASKKYFGFLIGFCVFLVATAPGFGPIYGGFIMKYFEFRDIFIFLIPFLVFALILGIFNIDDLSSKASFDYKEYFLILGLIVSLVCSVDNIGFFIVFLLLLYLLIKLKSNILKVAFNYRFFCSSLMVFLMQFFALSYSLILPNYLISVLDYDSFNASKVMFLGSISAALLAPISGFLSNIIGSFKLAFTGVILIIFSNILFLYLDENLLNFSISYLVYAFAQGMSMSVIIAYSINLSSDKTNANTYINTFQQCFGVLGVLVISKVFNDNYLIGFKNSIYVILSLAFLQLILIYFAFKNKCKV